jgi:UDP-glucose 4-epimerase
MTIDLLNLKQLEEILNQNDGRYIVIENDQPKLVILDAKKYSNLAASGTKSKVLVTGGAGYIGSIASRLLAKSGFDVLVLDNLSSGHSESVASNLIVGDLSDQALLDRIFEEHQIEAVVHFAGFIRVDESVKFPEKYFQNNVACGLNLLNSMVKHGVKRIVYSSSAAVYGNPEYTPIDENHPCNPVNPYGESKLVFEKILKWYHDSHGVSSVSFRYFNAAGAAPEFNLGEAHPVETHLIPKILDVACKKEEALRVFGSDYPTFDGTAVRDYVHVLDIAEAHVLGLKKLQQDNGVFVYNIGSSKGYSILEVVDAVMEATRKMIMIDKQDRRAGDPAVLVANNEKIRKELGLKLEHSDLPNIIKTAWEWHKQLNNKA